MPTSWGVLSRVGPARYPPDRCGLLLVSKSPGGALFMGLGCLGLLLPLRASGGAGGAPPATGTLFLRCISCRLWQNASTFISSKNPVTEVTKSSRLDMCTEPEQLPAQGTATGKAWWLQRRAPGRRGHDLGQVWPVEKQVARITSITSSGLARHLIPRHPRGPDVRLSEQAGRYACGQRTLWGLMSPRETDRGLCLPHTLGVRSARGLDTSTSTSHWPLTQARDKYWISVNKLRDGFVLRPQLGFMNSDRGCCSSY